LPPKESEDIVVEVQEKDAAVEELMSKISQDITSFDEQEEAGASLTLESTDLSLGLVMSPDSEDVNKTVIQGEEKEEKIDLDSLFSGLEEVDADLLFEETKKEDSLDSGEILQKVEEEIESVKYDKSDLFNDLLAGNDVEDKVQSTADGTATSATFELELEQEEEVLDDLLRESGLKEDKESVAFEEVSPMKRVVEPILEEKFRRLFTEKIEKPHQMLLRQQL